MRRQLCNQIRGRVIRDHNSWINSQQRSNSQFWLEFDIKPSAPVFAGQNLPKICGEQLLSPTATLNCHTQIIILVERFPEPQGALPKPNAPLDTLLNRKRPESL